MDLTLLWPTTVGDFNMVHRGNITMSDKFLPLLAHGSNITMSNRS